MTEQSTDSRFRRMLRRLVVRVGNLFKVKLWVKILVLGIPLTLAGYLLLIFVIDPSCGPGVARVDDQCIGVTDGEVELHENLADVLGKIWEENKRVEAEKSSTVSVAYRLTLPKRSADDELTVDSRLRHELEGAHIAQLQANRTQALGEKPLIRLLIANSGDESSQQPQVVSDLLAKVSEPDRLVAVVASGSTVSGTLEAIEDLRSGGLPVVMSRLAGDSFTPPDPNLQGGLARLAPSGRDQGAAAAAYLRQTANSVLIVRDTNPQDPYLRALDEAFVGAFSDGTHTVLEPPETYDSRLEGVANSMKGILRNICIQKPDVVFFAGRAPALNAFVQALPLRPCPELPINVMSGGSTFAFAASVAQGEPGLDDGLKANASVRYTTQGHPDAWVASPESFSAASTSYLTSTCEYCHTTVFPGENSDVALNDGGVIIGYDAILTAVAAIRPGYGTAGNNTPELVSQELKRLHGKGGAVPGAGGWISLDQFGNPVNKAVVILEVQPNGTLKFLELSSPLGSPCVPGTPPC